MKKRNSGFTLIELLVVIGMMAITTSSSIKVKPEFVGDFFMAKKNGPHGPLKEF